jgi:hypothetical protein
MSAKTPIALLKVNLNADCERRDKFERKSSILTALAAY